MRFDRKIVPGLEKRKWNTSMAAVALADTGLMAASDVGLSLEKEESIEVSYDGKRIELTSLGLDGRVMGIMFSSLGNGVASLYKATPNALGHELFDRWVADLIPARYSVKRL